MAANAQQPTFIPPASEPCLSLSAACCTPSFAEGITLQSIGPRIGFGEKIPFMGKEQKYYFHLYDVAAVIKFPWSWPLDESTWSLDTRMIASAGLLTGANESGLMMTVVPGLGLNGWKELVTFAAGAGPGYFSNYKFGTQDVGGAGSNRRDRGGSRQSIFSRLCRLSGPALLRCRPVRTVQSWRGHVHHRTWLPVLSQTSLARRSFLQKDQWSVRAS